MWPRAKPHRPGRVHASDQRRVFPRSRAGKAPCAEGFSALDVGKSVDIGGSCSQPCGATQVGAQVLRPRTLPEAAETPPNSVARFNVPGRKLPKSSNGDGAATVRPRIQRQGFTRFLTLADLDARTKAASRARQVLAAIQSDLGGE